MVCEGFGTNTVQTITFPCSFSAFYIQAKGWRTEGPGSQWSGTNAVISQTLYQILACGQINLSSARVGTHWISNLFCIGY